MSTPLSPSDILVLVIKTFGQESPEQVAALLTIIEVRNDALTAISPADDQPDCKAEMVGAVGLSHLGEDECTYAGTFCDDALNREVIFAAVEAIQGLPIGDLAALDEGEPEIPDLFPATLAAAIVWRDPEGRLTTTFHRHPGVSLRLAQQILKEVVDDLDLGLDQDATAS